MLPQNNNFSAVGRTKRAEVDIENLPVHVMQDDLDEINDPASAKIKENEIKFTQPVFRAENLTSVQKSSPFFAANIQQQQTEKAPALPEAQETAPKKSFFSFFKKTDAQGRADAENRSIKAAEKKKEAEMKAESERIRKEEEARMAEEKRRMEERRRIKETQIFEEKKRREEEREIAEQKRIMDEKIAREEMAAQKKEEEQRLAQEKEAEEKRQADRERIAEEKIAKEKEILKEKELEMSKNGNNGSKKDGSSKKLPSLLFFVIFLAVFFAGGYYYWLTKSSSQKEGAVVFEESEEESGVEGNINEKPGQEIVLEPEFSTDRPNYMTLSGTDQDSVKSDLLKYANLLKEGGIEGPVEFIPVDENNEPVIFRNFAGSFNLALPQSIMAELTDDFSIFIQNVSEKPILGLAIETKPVNALKSSLLSAEKDLIVWLSPIFMDAVYSAPSNPVFETNIYKNTKIRYFNIISAEVLTLDYAILEGKTAKLIISTTKSGIENIIDYEKSQPDATVDPSESLD
ncbi:MAG TPA: hypothetical protein DIT25_01840 [Candidatus Moranbacteria bacterium]|nr:hypothetical protein [Candidatus Moranbacteria bacterium]